MRLPRPPKGYNLKTEPNHIVYSTLLNGPALSLLSRFAEKHQYSIQAEVKPAGRGYSVEVTYPPNKVEKAKTVLNGKIIPNGDFWDLKLGRDSLKGVTLPIALVCIRLYNSGWAFYRGYSPSMAGIQLTLTDVPAEVIVEEQTLYECLGAWAIAGGPLSELGDSFRQDFTYFMESPFAWFIQKYINHRDRNAKNTKAISKVAGTPAQVAPEDSVDAGPVANNLSPVQFPVEAGSDLLIKTSESEIGNRGVATDIPNQ